MGMGIRHPKHVGVDLTGPMRTDRAARVRAGFGRAALAAFLKSIDAGSGALTQRADKLRKEGHTVVFVAIDGNTGGFLAIADPIKDPTREAIRALHAEGIRIVMLTGDTRATADAVARQLGIDEVIADVLPDQKAETIKRLQREGRFARGGHDPVDRCFMARQVFALRCNQAHRLGS